MAKTRQGANSEAIARALFTLDLPRVDKDNPEEIAQRLRDYFEWCQANDCRPTIVGLANWLGVDRKTLHRWRNGQYMGNPDCVRLLERAINLMEGVWADQMLDGDIPTAAGIFLGINHFGYRQQVDTVVRTESPLGELEDRKKLAARVGLEIPDEA